MNKILWSILISIALALLLGAHSGSAQNSPEYQRENRFLFVVDTSRAMRVYSNAVVQNVQELLASDLKGEFRTGDTIGLWTYNENLDPQFPMQVWSKQGRDSIADDITAFLRGRPYEKRGRLENVMPVLNNVIKSSERITVVLIFDGTGSIQGTPFDRDIKTLQKKYARTLHAAHVPFVMVLAARNGAVFDYTINYPGSVAVPHTANPEKPVVVPPPAVVAVAPAPEPPPRKQRVVGSIIMSRANTVVQAIPATPPAPAVVVVPPPAPIATPAPTPTPPPPLPASTVKPVAQVVPLPAPAPVVAATPAPLAPPQPAPVAPPTQPVVTTPTQPAPEVPIPQPAALSTTPAPVVVAPAPAQPVAVQSPPPATLTVITPVATIQTSGGSSYTLFAIALLLLTIAILLVVFLVRRSRGGHSGSLISQSIDHPR